MPNYIREYPRVGTFLVAWFTTKFTEPVRMGVSIAIVPPLAKFMKRYNLHDRQRDKFIEEHENEDKIHPLDTQDTQNTSQNTQNLQKQ